VLLSPIPFKTTPHPNSDATIVPMKNRRVVLTGLGAVTGFGIGIEPLWHGLISGQSAIGPIQSFDASAFPVQYGAEVDNELLKVRQYVPKSYRKAIKVMCRDIELAVVAAALAVEDANLITKANGSDEPVTYDPSRVGCQIGAGLIVADINELTAAFNTSRNEDGSFSDAQWGEFGMNELTPLWLLKFLPNMLACHVTIIHACRGPSNTMTCAEASGALSIGESTRVIERGDADLCFAGGSESKMNPLALTRQWHTKLLATTRDESDPNGSNSNGSSVIQPFGTDAKGSLPGEGGALVTVEAYETAKARGAKIYAEVLGFGASQSCDLLDGGLTPHPDGAGPAGAIERAIEDSGVEPSEIDTIVPMGTGAPAYDRAEHAALKQVFGESQLVSIPLVTTKPNIGLCAAATSAIDIVIGALCLRHRKLPARINGDSAFDGLDVGTVSVGEMDSLKRVLVCGSGFGGQNYAMVLGGVEG